MVNLCEKIGCAYWNAGRNVGGALGNFGCQRFTTAGHCPVSFVRGVTNGQYGVYSDEDAVGIIETSAKATCPDPLVRLRALRSWPLEEPERMKIGWQFREDGDHYEKIMAELRSLVEHFGAVAND